MGWNFGTADWAVVEGAMFPGQGGAAPGVWSLIAIILCIVILVMGNMKEHSLYKDVEK